MIRFFPFDIYQIGEVESYLQDMAARGFILTDLGYFAHYKKAEPQKITYRVEPKLKDEFGPSNDMLDSYKQFGWNYICTCEDTFYIFASYDESPYELHTEVSMQKSGYKYVERRWKITNVFVFSLLLVCVILIIRGIERGNFSVLYYIEHNKLIFHAILLVILIYSIIMGIIQIVRFRRILKNLRNGVDIEHNKKYKIRHENTILKVVIILLYIVGSFVIVYRSSVSWKVPFYEYDGNLPLITLNEIEQSDGSFNVEEYIYDVNYKNYVSHTWSELAPNIISTHQQVKCENYYSLSEGDKYIPLMDTIYYELRNDKLSGYLVRNLIETYTKNVNNNITSSQEIYDTGFEYAYYIQYNATQYLIAYNENKVIRVIYSGEKNLKDYIDYIFDKTLNYNDNIEHIK